MVFAFGLVLMIYVGTREEGKPIPWFIKTLATIAVFVAGYCLFDVVQQSMSAQKSIEDAQSELRKLQNPQ